MATIRSKNAEYQQIEALKHNRRKRSQMNLVFVESVQAINCAIANELAIQYAVVHADRTRSPWADRVVRSANAVHEVSSDLMAELSDKDDPSELIALVERPRFDANALTTDTDFVWVVFDRPSSPGNLGSVIRTCDAFGVDAVFTTGHGVDLFDPLTIRASVGALFNLTVGQVELPQLKDLIDTALEPR